MTYNLLLLPLINGLFGFAIVHFIILIVFKPYRQINFAGIKVHGLIPKALPVIAKEAGTFAKNKIKWNNKK